MSTAQWIICSCGAAYLVLIATIAIIMAVVVWKEERAEKKQRK